MSRLYTVGHSTHELGFFLELLQEFQIDAICDVRSSPYSQHNPQFNRETLKNFLKDQNKYYLFMGDEFGARRSERSCYVDGQAKYELIAETDLFKQGIDRLLEGVAKMNVALMCAEKDPITCHRTILVSRHMKMRGFEIVHILPDGTSESHSEAEERMLKQFKLESNDLFMSTEAILDRAYKLQGEKIAYRELSEPE